MAKSGISRRDALKLVGGAGVAAATGGLSLGLAQAAPATPNGAGFYRFKLGEYTLTLLSDGQTAPGNAFPNQGANAAEQPKYEQFMRDNFQDPTKFVNNFIPMLVDTGRSKILIDTGNGIGGLSRGVGRTLQHLQASGVKPEDINTVFLTHGHGDHITGLTSDGKPTYPNARLVMGEAEYNFWTTQANPSDSVKANLIGLKDRFTLLKAGEGIAPGLTAVATPGHTAGHMAVMVASGNAGLMHFGDAGGHFLLSLRYPNEHYLGFDSDKEQVVKTRVQMFGKAADEKLLVVGYHYFWPGMGYLRKKDNYFEFVPAFFNFS
jgi:glyoxylase-like metal-dependent hydrolase (beta-lactamase superfamily II)